MAKFGIISGALQGASAALETSAVDLFRSELLRQRDERQNTQQLERDKTKAVLDQETHAANAKSDLANIPARGVAETKVLDDRETTLRPGKLQTKREEADIEVDKKNRERVIVPAGSSLSQNGEIILTAPTKEPEEKLSYYTALKNRLNAETAAIEQGTRYGSQQPKPEKPTLPKVKVVKEGDENFIVDENSGAMGRIVPAQKGTPAEKNLIFPNKPGTPDMPARVEWSLNGEVLKGGIAELYPSLSARMSGAPGMTPAAAPVEGARQARDGKWYVPQQGGGWSRVDETPASAPKPAATRPAAPPAASPTAPAAQAGGGNAEAILRSGGIPALLEAVRKQYPPTNQRGRGGVVTGTMDSPEVQRLKGLTGPELLREANRLLGR